MAVSTVPERSLTSPSELASLVEALASTPQAWLERVRFRADGRWYERLERSDTHEVWAISWLPGQGTGFHDHGGSAGAFAVAFGTLEERRPGLQAHGVGQGQVRAFGAHDVHDVRNVSTAPAISIHAYSPPLSIMHRYELEDAGLVLRGTVFEDAGEEDTHTRTRTRTIDEILAAARARLQRVSPEQAYEAIHAGASLVDIRPAAQRADEGEIPGALVIERNVLEWRFDPKSDARLSIANGYAQPLIIVCSAGYTSSLAAASLQDLGLFRATDMIGGFHAWRAAGLPVIFPSRDAKRAGAGYDTARGNRHGRS